MKSLEILILLTCLFEASLTPVKNWIRSVLDSTELVYNLTRFIFSLFSCTEAVSVFRPQNVEMNQTEDQ